MTTEEDTDVGTIAEVDEEHRLDVDEGEGANALEDGDDTDDLEDVYADPGEVIDLEDEEADR